MLDIKLIRENSDKIKQAVIDKQLDPAIVDEVLDLDKKKRALLQKLEAERAERNRIAYEVSTKKTDELIERGRIVKAEIQSFESDLRDIDTGLKNALLQIPNPAADDVKIGKDDSENEVIRKEGKVRQFDFTPKDHIELGKNLEIVDVERSPKVSGARFGYLKGDAVFLEFALINFAMKTLMTEGFEPIIPPVLMKVPVFHQLGYSEHLGNENYYFVIGDPNKKSKEEEEGYYLVGTAEHSIVPYYKDEILPASDLPKRFIGFSTAFRREAGSYGKDTKGMLRVHQFDKVEMVSFTKQEDSDKEHEYLLSLEENLFKALEIPYQVVKMCTGDLGAPAARKYDLEAWIPSQNKYREVTSTSTCTDYQARRLNIKYKDKNETKYVHILNGTAFAIGRTIIAILENYQQKDGSINIPKILQSFIGKSVIK